MSIRKTWSAVCEAELNKQIKREYTASLYYHQLSAYFNRSDVADLGVLSPYFNNCSLEEREHAHMLMEYQTKRGGIVELDSIQISDVVFKTDNKALEALTYALELEQNINSDLLNIHELATKENDPHFCDFLGTHFLNEQVEAIYKLQKLVSQLTAFGDDLYGIYKLIDDELA